MQVPVLAIVVHSSYVRPPGPHGAEGLQLVLCPPPPSPPPELELPSVQRPASQVFGPPPSEEVAPPHPVGASVARVSKTTRKTDAVALIVD